MQQKVLVKAIAMAATGVAMSVGAVGSASADVMYNTYFSYTTDGWVTEGGKTGLGPVVPWLGLPAGELPFGLTAGMNPANWAAQINSPGEHLEVSAADAAARFNGAFVDLDTNNGSWGQWPNPVDPKATTQGWGHNTDFGLIRSAVDTKVRLDVSKVDPADNISNFGITVFEGMHKGDFSHHLAWNDSSVPGGFTKDNPFLGTGNIYLTHGANSYVEFFAHANQVYTIYLGGNDVNGDIFLNTSGYKVDISSAPVPVPAAAWLFGSGLMGLVGFRHRKPKPA